MTHEQAVRKAQYHPTMPHGAIWLTVEEATGVVRAYLEARAVDAVSYPWPEQETQGNFARYLLHDFGEER